MVGRVGSRIAALLPLITVASAAIVVVVTGALARSHGPGGHRGVPSAIFVDRHVGPYLASLWADTDVGAGTIYVVIRSAERTFIPPSTVRVALAPVSRRTSEVTHDAHPQAASPSGGARYMAHVMFDRAERLNVRVVVEGPAGGGEVRAQVESKTSATFGPIGLVLSTMPFFLVAVVWWRATVARQRMVARA